MLAYVASVSVRLFGSKELQDEKTPKTPVLPSLCSTETLATQAMVTHLAKQAQCLASSQACH